MKHRGVASWAFLAAIFVAALVVIHRWSGDSPALWLDTLNDDREVRQCVLQGSCTLLGQNASIPGLFLAGGWLAVRSFLFYLGVGLDGVHLLLQALDALGVVLVAIAGIRLRGRALGAVAAFVLVYDLGLTAGARQAVYNTAPLPFLGAALLLACLAAVERPGVLPSVVTALLAAVMADFHTCCAAAGVTVVWVALLAPGRRVLRAAVAAAVFAAAAFAIAPFAWIENVRVVLHGARGAGASAQHPSIAGVFLEDSLARYAAVGVGAWLFCVVTGRASLRRVLDVPAATSAPMLAAFVVALGHGASDSGGKYLAHVKPAAALGVAAVVVASVPWLLARTRWRRALRDAIPRAARASPWAAALGIALLSPRGARRARWQLPLFTMRDVEAVGRVLRDERGWSRARVLHHVKAIEQTSVVAALLGDVPGGWPDPPSGARGDDDPTTAFVLQLDAADLPDPLPPSWTVARRTPSTAAVIVFTPSALDWERLALCSSVHGAWRCTREGEPTGDMVGPGRLLLRVPLRAPPAVPAAPTHVFMPRSDALCAGSVAAVPGPGSHIAPDGRDAVVAGGATGALEIAWDLFTPACPGHLSHRQPHFFVEGAPADVAALEAVLRRHER